MTVAEGGRDMGQSGRGRKGQSTLEYILVLAAILVAVIAAAGLVMKPAVNQAMTDSSNTIQNATGKLKGGLGL